MHVDAAKYKICPYTAKNCCGDRCMAWRLDPTMYITKEEAYSPRPGQIEIRNVTVLNPEYGYCSKFSDKPGV